MEAWQALILGAVQALAEFLPISSSGHLILIPALAGWPQHSLSFDVALHLGTAAALLLFFWREWVRLAGAVGQGLIRPAARQRPEWRFAWLLVLGGVPAGVAGLLGQDFVETQLRSPFLVAGLLIVFGLVLGLADWRARQYRALKSLGWRDALLIGSAQVLALAPGVSRSGVTLTAGLALGFTRAEAARFSFLLSGPIILGAALAAGRSLLRTGLSPDEAAAFLIGMVTAALLGMVVIWGLLRYLEQHSLRVFVLYRLVFGLLVLAVLALRS